MDFQWHEHSKYSVVHIAGKRWELGNEGNSCFLTEWGGAGNCLGSSGGTDLQNRRETTLCFWIIAGHPAVFRHQTCHGDVHLFPSLTHAEADEAVDSESIQAAAEGAWPLPVPKGSFPAPLPRATQENLRTIKEFGLEGTFRNHPLQPPRTEVLTA